MASWVEWSNEEDANCGNFKWRYDGRSGNLQFKQLQSNLKKKNQNSTGAITTFCIVYCEAVARGLDNV